MLASSITNPIVFVTSSLIFTVKYSAYGSKTPAYFCERKYSAYDFKTSASFLSPKISANFLSGPNEVFFYGGTCGLWCSNTLTIAFSPALSGTSITLKYQFPHTAQCQYQHTGDDTLTITVSSNLSYTSSSCGVAVSPSLTSLSQISATGRQGQGHAYFGNITVDGSNDNIFIDDQIVLTFANSSDVTGFAAGQLIYKQGDTAVRGKVESVNSASSPYTITIRSNSTWGNGDVLQTTDLLNEVRTIFPSGLWWIKDRQNSNQHQLVDSFNGTSDVWQVPNATGSHTYSAPTGNSVAWCWKAGGAAVSNGNGSITSIVSANIDAGFSIVQYTGNGSNDQTVGHGLGKKPEFIFLRGLAGATTAWHHLAASPANGWLYLHSDQEWNNFTDDTIFQEAGMSATTFGIGSDTAVNQSTTDYTAYVWTSIPGYSAFGSYTGKSSTDGPFVYTGFRPAFVMIKSASATSHWQVYDSTRNVSNPTTLFCSPDNTLGETTNSDIDLISNGFKIRSSNTPGGTVIYAAFAEKPSFAKNFSSANPR